MTLPNVTCVSPTGDVCGEGAVWCAEESAVYWTDINRFLVHRYDTIAYHTRTWIFDEPVVALSLSSEPGRLLVALGSRLLWWWPSSNRRQSHGFVLPGSPHVRLNDGRADPLGNFWVGSMRNNVQSNGEALDAGGTDGVLYRIAPDGTVSVWMDGIGISNTMCWSPDHRSFYTADTLANELYAFDFDPVDASISNRRALLSGFERGS